MCRFPHYSLTEVQMKILNFFESYHLHDSLLENVEIDEAAKTVMLTVDFCFWQQDNYDSRKPETGIIHILFSAVSQVSFEPYKMNSDEIATCELLDGNILKLIVYNDVSETYHSISIRAEDVAVEGE